MCLGESLIFDGEGDMGVGREKGKLGLVWYLRGDRTEGDVLVKPKNINGSVRGREWFWSMIPEHVP